MSKSQFLKKWPLRGIHVSQTHLVTFFFSAERKKIISIAVPVVLGTVGLGILIAVIVCCWRQKERAKENTAKLTAKMTGVVDAEVGIDMLLSCLIPQLV